MMARLLEVSRSGFYSLLTNVASTDDWGHVRDAVERVWLESDRRFGARMVHAFLPPELGPVTLYRVRKCMRELGIRGVTPNAKKCNMIPDEGASPKLDLVARDFISSVTTYELVGDITYLRTGQGWLFLATVIDLDTRMVVGWAMSECMTADIVVSALELVRRRGYVAEGPSSTATAAASAPRGRWRRGLGKTTWGSRAAAPAVATTTRWQSLSSRPSRTRCTTAARLLRARR